MKSIEIHNAQLNTLLINYDKELELNGYEAETRRAHLCSLRRLQPYMDRQGIQEYSVSVGDSFYQEYRQSHKNIGTCDVVKAIIKKFNTFCDDGFVPPPDRGAFYNQSLKDLMDKLEAELRLMGYPNPAIHFYRRLLRPVQHFMRKNGIEVYTPDMGLAYMDWYANNHDRASTYVIRFIKSCISRVNDIYDGGGYVRLHSSRTGIKPPILFLKNVEDFLESCRLSGNKPATLRIKEIAISQFLTACIAEGCQSISDITPSIVIRACNSIGTKRYWTYIGSFLQHQALSGTMENDLSTFVPETKLEQRAPSTYTIDEISSAESCVDRSECRGKRDYAIFLLASRLGIRSGDILRMHRDNLDFNNNIISFTQYKTKNAISLPMLPEIREAIEDHVACSGYSPDGYLFVSSLAPYGLLSNTTIGNIITKYLEKASVDTTGKHHGPHSLRASMATSMVNDSVPYDAVRKTLGHTNPNAIKHYAKNDLENLRRCAIDVPEATGMLLDFLGEEDCYE